MPSDPLTELTLAELRTRTSTKWREFPPDVLPLWVAEMDVHLAPPVREAMERALRDGDTGYPDGRTGYAEALASFAADRWGWGGLDPARSTLVADVMGGVVEAIRLVTDPGSPVVVSPPVYPPFFGFVGVAGREVVTAPLGPGGRLDLAALEEVFVRCRGRRAAYLLCSPHNPTGVVHTPEELAGLAALAREHGVRVVVDEIHAPLVLEGAAFTPYLSVPGGEDAFSLMSASKSFNLAGAKAAVLLAGPEAAADLARVPEVVSHGPSHLGIIGHVAGLSHGRDWLDALLVGLARNRTLLGELLDKHLPGLSWVPPEATFLSWLDCGGLDLTLEPVEVEPGLASMVAGPAAVFLERGRVALSSGPAFGPGGEDHVRLNYATSPEILTEAVERMGTALTRP